MLVYIIEEKCRIFDLVKKMLKNTEKYIFLYEDAAFSEDIKKYINYNEVLVFRAVSPINISNSSIGTKVDLVVFGDLENSINNFNLSKVKTFLLNIENANQFKNINFGSSQIITCGLREKDTVIFSSIDLDAQSVMLDLQRTILNIKDKNIESFEKKILLESGIKGEDMQETLFALSVLLYCGRLS